MRERLGLIFCMVLCLLLVLPTGCGSQPGLSRYTYTQVHMGSPARIVLYAPDEIEARLAARAAFARIAELDKILSDYLQDSETNRLCDGPAWVWTPVSPDLFRVLERSGQMHEASGGAFDCTLGPLTRLWRQARREGRLPTDTELADARARSGWGLVDLDRQTRMVRLRAEGMQLDFGAIGKGYAAGEAVWLLAHQGLGRCLVDFGGDIAMGDPPPGEEAWEIRVDTGYDEGERPTVRADWAGVATSGDTSQYIEIEGVRYSHILDPTTGLGLTTRTAATVIGADGPTADALASAVCVLGPERAEAAFGSGFWGRRVGVRMVVDGRVYRFGLRAAAIEDH